ncbi:MAG: efflux transporter outer membrane subunit [Opitutales bacterium]|nr:efflux transporter outer membrane subunit [Opitutales bacterium]
MKNTAANLLIAASALALGGCMVGPDYVAPTSEIAKEELGKEHFFRDDGLWKEAVPAESLPKGEWWKIFADPTLDKLLEQCSENSPTLSAAFYRVEQARQNARIDAAAFYPQGNGKASFARTGYSRNIETGYTQTDRWTVGLGMTWDLDLFGRIRSIINADVADAEASYDAYNSLMLTMHAQVAKQYFTIRQFCSEIELLERTLEVRKEQTELISNRVKLDFASDLDLQRAVQQEAEAAAQLAAVRRAMAIAKNNIAILVGTTPSKLVLPDAPLGENLPKLPKAVPSELLERRPDIAAAERKVYAANARIGAAQAGFFPTVSISANTDLQANKIDKLLNSSSFAWGVSPQIYIPIFQAGRVYAQKQVALAAHKETLENYKAAVLSAIGEVENAMSQINNLRIEYKRRMDVTKASNKVFELTRKQYDLGFVDYFSVSDASRNALLNEREQISLRGDRFRACVDFIAAIGGGWQTDAESVENGDIKPAMYESANLDPKNPGAWKNSGSSEE